MSESDRNRWITEKETVIIDSPFMRFFSRDCKSSEDGVKHRFYLFHSRDWCNVIPITEEGNVVLVRQFRIGIDDHALEIPGGVVDTTDGKLADAAIRELAEETGYEPLPGALTRGLGWTFPNPAIQNNRCHSFIVGPVRKVRDQQLDHGELMDVVEVPIAELPERIRNGEIRHALILNAFLFLMLESDRCLEFLADGLTSFRKAP